MIIHHVWPAHDPIPYTFRANMETFARHNPGWRQKIWTEADIDGLEMVNRDLYDAAKTEAPDDWIRWRADIARLEIVYQFGGIYADTDAECVAPLEPLLEYPCWFAESPNAPGHATQAVFGAEPGHPFIGHALHKLPQSAARNKGKRINHRVGSRFVDYTYQTVMSGRLLRSLPEVLPWDWFAGQSIKGRGKTKPVKSRYIDHHYFNSERHSAKAQIAAFRAAAGLLDASGATWFLTSGLLLGHVREGRILPWDLDVDIGIFPEDIDKVRAAFDGWEFKRDFDSQMWPVHNKTKIDIHSHYRDGDTVYKLHGKRQNIRMDYPAELFDDLRPTVFYMRDTLMPYPPEEYLAVMYGSDWLTPKRDWKWDKSPANITRL